MAVLLTALLSIGVHLLVGWEGTVLAGVVGGLFVRTASGWLVGAGGAAIAWTTLVVYTASVAPASFHILVDTLGTLAGNIPGEAIVGLTVFLGSLLGGLGGGIGTLLRPFVPEELRTAG